MPIARRVGYRGVSRGDVRVLVTGGSGFLGANVVRHLLDVGDEVRCTLRRTSKATTLEGLPITRVEAELTDREALARAIDGCDVVMHVAGLYDPGPGGEDRMREIHVDASAAILDAAAMVGVRRVVLCSSSITVGFGPKDRPGDEDSPLDPDATYGVEGPLRTYHDTKRAEEAMAARDDVDVVIVNPDYVIGAWDVKPTSGALILASMRRWIPVYARGGKCFVDADDAAAAHRLAAERGVRGQRYLLGAHNLSYREFQDATAHVIGRRPPMIPLSRRLVRAADRVIGAVPAPPAVQGGVRLLGAMQQERYRSGRRAIAELGMPVSPIEVSIEKAARWFRDHGYVGSR